MSNTATIFTSHVWNSDRRAGFHWIADGFMRRGWHVNFVTGYSLFDHFVVGGYRKVFVDMSVRNKVVEASENLTTFINTPWMRPTGLRSNALNAASYNPFKLYRHAFPEAVKEMVASSRLILMESTYEIMFAPRLRTLNNNARFVYRVSDDMAARNTHPIGLADELRALPLFDLVSLPNAEMCKRFPRGPSVVEHKHGIPTQLYDQESLSPFETNSRNAVFTGNNILDQNAIRVLAERFPDYVFHVVGPFHPEVSANNVLYYGEMPYLQTIPFVQHAQIGLNTLTVPGFEESNKMQQYRYCGLPAVVNGTLVHAEKDRFFYKTGDADSLVEAFNAAMNYNPDPTLRATVRSWDDLVSDLLGEA